MHYSQPDGLASKVQSIEHCGREGAVQALAVQRARRGRSGDGQRGAHSAPVAAKLAAVAAPETVSVPVDTSPTVVKFPALAVLLMVSVLPVILVAELSRPTLAAPVMLSELPDTAPVDDSAAPATVPVAVSAAQETAPEASTPVVKTSVQFTSLHSSWSQPTLPCAVSPSSVAEPVRVAGRPGHRRAGVKAGQQRAGAGNCAPGHGSSPGHHGRTGGRARKQHRCAAELADHGSLQQGRPIGLRRAGGRGGH